MTDVTLKYEGLLLLGPTGSGKTPLGEILEKRGLAGRTCHHFDFGAELRAAAGFGGGDNLEAAERETIWRVLRDGVLLEDPQFPIALKILSGFISRRGVRENEIIVLNGLPRHLGQAQGIAGLVDISAVVLLEADPSTIRGRIGQDSGGDRAGRADDSAEEIDSKTALFNRRTRPLAAHYGAAGRPILTLEVRLATTAETMWYRLEKFYQALR